MSDFNPGFVYFLAGIAAAVLWSELSESKLVSEADSAERDGHVINNEMMQTNYPESFRTGYPQYLERDFEAGADLICDEIRLRYQQDMCSSDGVGWD